MAKNPEKDKKKKDSASPLEQTPGIEALKALVSGLFGSGKNKKSVLEDLPAPKVDRASESKPRGRNELTGTDYSVDPFAELGLVGRDDTPQPGPTRAAAATPKLVEEPKVTRDLAQDRFRRSFEGMGLGAPVANPDYERHPITGHPVKKSGTFVKNPTSVAEAAGNDVEGWYGRRSPEHLQEIREALGMVAAPAVKAMEKAGEISDYVDEEKVMQEGLYEGRAPADYFRTGADRLSHTLNKSDGISFLEKMGVAGAEQLTAMAGDDEADFNKLYEEQGGPASTNFMHHLATDAFDPLTYMGKNMFTRALFSGLQNIRPYGFEDQQVPWGQRFAGGYAGAIGMEKALSRVGAISTPPLAKKVTKVAAPAAVGAGLYGLTAEDEIGFGELGAAGILGAGSQKALTELFGKVPERRLGRRLSDQLGKDYAILTAEQPMHEVTAKNLPESIIGEDGAAIRVGDKIFRAEKHVDAVKQMREAGYQVQPDGSLISPDGKHIPKVEDGWMTNKNRFVDRITAAQIAESAGQVPAGMRVNPDGLYSEDFVKLKTPTTPEAEAAAGFKHASYNDALVARIQELGYRPEDIIPVGGRYQGGDPEQSFVVRGMSREHALQLGKEFGQNEVIVPEGMVEVNTGMTAPFKGKALIGDAAREQDFYSEAPEDFFGPRAFSMQYDFDNRMPLDGGKIQGAALRHKETGEVLEGPTHPDAFLAKHGEGKSQEEVDGLVESMYDQYEIGYTLDGGRFVSETAVGRTLGQGGSENVTGATLPGLRRPEGDLDDYAELSEGQRGTLRNALTEFYGFTDGEIERLNDAALLRWGASASQMAGKRQADADEPYVDLKRYTTRGDLRVLDPWAPESRTGMAGAELKRADDPSYEPRLYYYDKEASPEPKIEQGTQFVHETRVPERLIYDLANDTQGFAKAAMDEYGQLNFSKLEQLVKDAGYVGYRHTAGPMAKAVAIFAPLKSERVVDTDGNVVRGWTRVYDGPEGSESKAMPEFPAASIIRGEDGRLHMGYTHAHADEYAGGDVVGDPNFFVTNTGRVVSRAEADQLSRNGVDALRSSRHLDKIVRQTTKRLGLAEKHGANTFQSEAALANHVRKVYGEVTGDGPHGVVFEQIEKGGIYGAGKSLVSEAQGKGNPTIPVLEAQLRGAMPDELEKLVAAIPEDNYRGALKAFGSMKAALRKLYPDLLSDPNTTGPVEINQSWWNLTDMDKMIQTKTELQGIIGQLRENFGDSGLATMTALVGGGVMAAGAATGNEELALAGAPLVSLKGAIKAARQGVTHGVDPRMEQFLRDYSLPEATKKKLGKIYGEETDLTIVGAGLLKEFRDFTSWSKKMESLYGKKIRPFRDDLYDASWVRAMSAPEIKGSEKKLSVGKATEDLVDGNIDLTKLPEEKAQEQLMEFGVRDAIDATQRMGDARQWYKAAVAEMEKKLKRAVPQLQEPEDWALFKFLLALTSQGAKVQQNMDASVAAIKHYLETGKPSLSKRDHGGSSSRFPNTQMKKVEAFFEKAEELGSKEAAVQYYLSKFDKEVGRGNNKKTVQAYRAVEELGPKVGRFLLNLHGIHDEVTMDKWATRSYRRLMGYLDKSENPNKTESRGGALLFKDISEELSAVTGQDFEAADIQALLWYYEQELFGVRGAYDTSKGSITFSDAAHKSIEGELPQEAINRRTDLSWEDYRPRMRGERPVHTEPKAGGRAVAIRQKPGKQKKVTEEQAAERGELLGDSPRSIFPIPDKLHDVMEPKFGYKPKKGGNYIDMASKEDVTGKTFSAGIVSVKNNPKGELLVNPEEAAEVAGHYSKVGKTTRVNLFKRSAGWKPISGSKALKDAGTIVSVEVGKDHFYTLETKFAKPVSLNTYPKGGNPTLRPTTKGNVELGKKIGEMNLRGNKHPVYDSVTIRGMAAMGLGFSAAYAEGQEGEDSLRAAAPEFILGGILVGKRGLFMGRQAAEEVGQRMHLTSKGRLVSTDEANALLKVESDWVSTQNGAAVKEYGRHKRKFVVDQPYFPDENALHNYLEKLGLVVERGGQVDVGSPAVEAVARQFSAAKTDYNTVIGAAKQLKASDYRRLVELADAAGSDKARQDAYGVLKFALAVGARVESIHTDWSDSLLKGIDPKERADWIREELGEMLEALGGRIAKPTATNRVVVENELYGDVPLVAVAPVHYENGKIVVKDRNDPELSLKPTYWVSNRGDLVSEQDAAKMQSPQHLGEAQVGKVARMIGKSYGNPKALKSALKRGGLFSAIAGMAAISEQSQEDPWKSDAARITALAALPFMVREKMHTILSKGAPWNQGEREYIRSALASVLGAERVRTMDDAALKFYAAPRAKIYTAKDNGDFMPEDVRIDSPVVDRVKAHYGTTSNPANAAFIEAGTGEWIKAPGEKSEHGIFWRMDHSEIIYNSSAKLDPDYSPGRAFEELLQAVNDGHVRIRGAGKHFSIEISRPLDPSQEKGLKKLIQRTGGRVNLHIDIAPTLEQAAAQKFGPTPTAWHVLENVSQTNLSAALREAYLKTGLTTAEEVSQKEVSASLTELRKVRAGIARELAKRPEERDMDRLNTLRATLREINKKK